VNDDSTRQNTHTPQFTHDTKLIFWNF